MGPVDPAGHDVLSKNSYGEFLESEEKIATNILSSGLTLLESNGFITKRVSAANKSKFVCYLTEKGIDVMPAVAELLIWSAKYNSWNIAQESL